MADSDNTQTKPAGLPEKEWFTLEEVAGRWGCPVNNLLHWGGQDLLEICAFKPIEQGRRYENLYSSEDEEAEITLEPEIQSENFREWWVAPIFSVFDMYKTPLFALGRFDLQFIEREGFSEVSEGAVGAFTLELFHPDPELAYVRLAAIDLFITRLERDRFEKEHRIGAYAGTMPDLTKPDRLDPRKETTYLQIIRALLAEAKMPQEHYKAADALMQAAAKNGLVMPGKRDTIAEKLKAARDLSD